MLYEEAALPTENCTNKLSVWTEVLTTYPKGKCGAGTVTTTASRHQKGRRGKVLAESLDHIWTEIIQLHPLATNVIVVETFS